MRYRNINESLASKKYSRMNELASEALNKKKENKEMTPEEIRKKAEVEKKMQEIRAIMNKRLKEANTEEALKRQEEEQRAKVEALRQKLKREKQAQIIKEMAEKNAVKQKAAILASQIAAREEQKARETGKTSNFDAEEKKRQIMDAYYTQQDKVKARNLMGTEVDLELAEDDLKETEAALDRMEKVEEIMQELREEEAKRIEEAKKEKTNTIQNIFKKLTSWPRRNIPTQEEISKNSLQEGISKAKTEESKTVTEAKGVVKSSESKETIKKEDIMQNQEKPKTELDEFKKILLEKDIITQQQLNEMKYKEEKEDFIAKAKKKIALKMKNATQHYEYSASIQSNMKGITPFSRKEKKRTKNDMLRELYGGFQTDLNKAYEDSLKKSQSDANKFSPEIIR